MNNRTNTQRSAAHVGRKVAILAGALALGVGAFSVATHADAPDPDTVTVEQAGDTITVKVDWSWSTHKKDCATDRYAVGFAVNWDDPDQPGNVVISGVEVGTPTDNAVHMSHPCSNSGTDFTLTHTYTDSEAASAAFENVCAVTYDVHFNKAKDSFKAKDDIAGGAGHNKDNSSQANKKTPLGNICNATEFISDGELTLIKVVHNGPDGTATPANFTLTATGTEGDPPLEISGKTGDDEITAADVPAGDYTLTEMADEGTDGYTSDGWDCGDAPVVDGVVSVLAGADVTCTVTNHDASFGQEAPTTLVTTGSNTADTTYAAILLALIGGGLVMVSRRRRTA